VLQLAQEDLEVFCVSWETSCESSEEWGTRAHAYRTRENWGVWEDPVHNSDEVSSSRLRCCTSGTYDVSFKVLNIIGGAIGSLHVSFLISNVVYSILFLFTNTVFMVRTSLKSLLFIVPCISGIYTYQKMVYLTMFCSYNESFCRHPPEHYHTVVSKVFSSALAVSVVSFVLQATYVTLFLRTFVQKRVKIWDDIIAIENSIIFTKELEHVFEARKTLNRTYNIQNFETYWMNKKDEDIIHELPAKARSVMWAMRETVRNSTTSRDTSGRHAQNHQVSISRDKFDRYADRNGLQGADKVWSILTCNYMYEVISLSSVEDVMYDLFFRRKQLAAMIFTDRKLLLSMVMYLSVVLYPVCALVTAKIFDYEDAFNSGVDLFKTYTVIVALLSSRVMDSLQFLWLMLTDRPFNIGDVLQLSDAIYNVTDFNATHTFLRGATCATITNVQLFGSPVVNLTKDYVNDSFKMVAPLNSLYCTESMWETVRRYMADNPRDICASSVRCGWTGVSGEGKTICCTWRYKFRIMDRSRLNQVRTRIMDYFVSRCDREIIRAFLAFNYVNGGGRLATAAASNTSEHDNSNSNTREQIIEHVEGSWNKKND